MDIIANVGEVQPSKNTVWWFISSTMPIRLHRNTNSCYIMYLNTYYEVKIWNVNGNVSVQLQYYVLKHIYHHAVICENCTWGQAFSSQYARLTSGHLLYDHTSKVFPFSLLTFADSPELGKMFWLRKTFYQTGWGRGNRATITVTPSPTPPPCLLHSLGLTFVDHVLVIIWIRWKSK